jgi:hypothetical protein
MSAIVQLYVKKIKAGELYIDDVPLRWRAEVEKELEKNE